MEKLTEPQADFVRALMTGAGLLDYGNPLAYFTDHQVTPDQFYDAFQRCVPEDMKQATTNYYIDAYNAYATEHMFWNMVGDLEDWE